MTNKDVKLGNILKMMDTFKEQLHSPYEVFLECSLLILYSLHKRIRWTTIHEYILTIRHWGYFKSKHDFITSTNEQNKHVSDPIFLDLVYLAHPTLKNIEFTILKKLYDDFISSTNYLQEFDELYFSLIESLLCNINAHGYHTPEGLSEFVISILNKEAISSVYNPFAGMAFYSLGLNDNISYYGQEVNERLCVYGNILLEAHIPHNSEVEIGNSFENWSNRKFDAIVSDVPWGTIIQSRERLESWFLRKASETCGKMSIGVYPYSVLTHVDQQIISRGDIDTIIKLPEFLFAPLAHEKTCIVITNKKHNHFGSVRFIDASSLYFNEEKRIKLDSKLLLNLYYGLTENQELIKFVKVQDIIEQNGRMEVERYFIREIDIPAGYHLCSLKDFTTIVGVRKRDVSGNVPVIKISDLAKTKVEYILNHNDLSTDIYHTGNIYINENVLLLSRIRTLKPTLYINGDGGAYINGNITALRVDEEKVSIPYLINELRKEYVQSRLVYSGGTTPSISIRDIMNLQILVPDSKDKFLQDIQTSLSEQAQTLKADFDKFKEQAKIELRMRKHAISQVLQDLLIAFDDLKDVREDNNGVLRDKDIISPLDGSTVASYFEKMGTACLRIDKMVKSLTDESSYGEPEDFLLGEFLEEFKSSHIQHGYLLDVKRNYTAEDEYAVDEETGKEDYTKILHRKGDLLDNYVVCISKKDLTQVIENILANARKYGFIENRIDYVVQMELREDSLNNERAVSLLIKNNGKSLPQGMTPEKVFAWGESSADGTGIGGWQVKNIVEHFKGQVRLFEFTPPVETEGFTLAYEIKLPIKEEDI